MAYDESTAARVRQVLAGQPGLVEKKMMGGLCFMVRGGMCCSVSGKGGLLVRVTPEGYRTTEELRAWVLRGVAGVVRRKASAHPRPRRKRRAGRVP